MALDTLTAANGGTPAPLAGRTTGQGFVGAVMMTDATGAEVNAATAEKQDELIAIFDGTNQIGSVAVSKTALTASAPAVAAIAATSTAALALNANRRGAILKNTSTAGQRISLAFSGGTAVLDSGVTLETGDVFTMDEYTFTTGAINAIASAASGRLSVQEWVA